MSIVQGRLTGLKPAQLKSLEKLSQRRISPHSILTNDFARAICEISFEIQRQVGVLVNRSGRIEYCIVGDAGKLFLPDLKRTRIANQRFRGLRLLHTHLRQGEGLSEDDLTDLTLLRLDLIAAITLNPQGLPAETFIAHLLPENKANELWQIYPPQHPAEIKEDFLDLITALENEFADRFKARKNRQKKERAYLIGVYPCDDSDAKNRMEELERLAHTSRLEVIDKVSQFRAQPDSKFFIGKGKLQDIALHCMQKDVDILIFDHDLSPSQAKTISDFVDLKIIDRTQLILDIFAQHAISRDGKMQIELAQLNYLKPRLSERDDNMSRLTGGIGGRGPGETKLEIGRRRIQDRITKLDKDLQALRRQRDLRRNQRKHSLIPVVSIIGYTNAGKSTLLNALTNSDVIAQDALFATLDPTARRIRFPDERELILTDTVGFIQDLPPTLIQAFKATLEELDSSDLLLHVINISSEFLIPQFQAVLTILEELNLNHIPRLTVFNQVDRISSEQLQEQTALLCESANLSFNELIFISALHKQNLPSLIHAIEKILYIKEIR